MAQLLIRDISPDVVAKLKERLWLNRRSLQGEALTILEQAVERTAAVERLRTAVDEIAKRPSSQPQTDSADIIHEMRYGPEGE